MVPLAAAARQPERAESGGGVPPLSADPTCGVGVAAQGLSLFANFAYNDFQSVAHEMRSHCSQIYSTLRQPVPFAYFHLLNLMVIVNLLLLAYGMAGLAPPPVTIVCFTISCIVFIGLRDLGKGGAASRHCQHRASSPHPRSSSVRLTSSCVPSPPFRPQLPNPCAFGVSHPSRLHGQPLWRRRDRLQL